MHIRAWNLPIDDMLDQFSHMDKASIHGSECPWFESQHRIWKFMDATQVLNALYSELMITVFYVNQSIFTSRFAYTIIFGKKCLFESRFNQNSVTQYLL